MGLSLLLLLILLGYRGHSTGSQTVETDMHCLDIYTVSHKNMITLVNMG